MSQRNYRNMRLASWRQLDAVIIEDAVYPTAKMPDWMLGILIDVG